MERNAEILKLNGISKSFPGVKVLDKITLSFHAGRVHALMGENGAGKSTLMNIIFGYHHPDEGSLILDGEETVIADPLDAQARGIAMIHQENSLIPYLSVMNNIYLGNYPKKGIFVDEAKLKANAQELLNQLEISDIEPGMMVEKLSVAQKQLVEIAKALSRKPRLLMMDEPTATLTEKESAILMRIIQRLKEEGVSIIYVSHRLEEVFAIADDITVLRDGEVMASQPKDTLEMNEAVKLMVGRDLESQVARSRADSKGALDGEVVLEVKNLSLTGKFSDVSFRLKRGEVLGFAGLVGAGRTEVAEAIFGYCPAQSGEIYIHGKKVDIRHPRSAIAHHMAMLPEERKVKGLFGVLNVKENINIASYQKHKIGGLIRKSREEASAWEYVKQFHIKTPTIYKPVGNLSGGNQQKTILSRWLQTDPEILILDEPTHGIDVGTKAEIYRVIRELAKKGMSIILISSELPELLALSDEILVMCRGTACAVLNAEEATEETIMFYATGLNQTIESQKNNKKEETQ